jgi:putative transposase
MWDFSVTLALGGPKMMRVPASVNQRWSMGIVTDQLANGRCFRFLNIVDDYSRKIVLQVVDYSISGNRVA